MAYQNSLAYAEINESNAERFQLDVKVTGMLKREFLVIITNKFDSILKAFNGLKYGKLTSCPCDNCLTNSDTFFHDLDVIKEALKSGIERIQCHKSFQFVKVAELIGIINYEKLRNDLSSFESDENSLGLETLDIIISNQNEMNSKLEEISEGITYLGKTQSEIETFIEKISSSASNIKDIESSMKDLISNLEEKKIEEMKEFLAIALRDSHVKNMKEFDEIKSTLELLKNPESSWETKVKFAVPLINLIGM